MTFGVYLGTAALITGVIAGFGELRGQGFEWGMLVLGLILAVPVCAWRPLFGAFYVGLLGMVATIAIIAAVAGREQMQPAYAVLAFPICLVLFLVWSLRRR